MNLVYSYIKKGYFNIHEFNLCEFIICTHKCFQGKFEHSYEWFIGEVLVEWLKLALIAWLRKATFGLFLMRMSDLSLS